MPVKSEIDNIMARGQGVERTRRWRRYPARSGVRAAVERPAPISASASYKALGGEIMVEVHVVNRTGREVVFEARVGNDHHEIAVDGNANGTALFSSRSHAEVIVRVQGSSGSTLYEGVTPNIGKESFA